MLIPKLLLIVITLLSGAAALSLGLTVLLTGFKADHRRKAFSVFAAVVALWIIAGQLVPILLTDVTGAQLVNTISQSFVNLVALSFVLFIWIAYVPKSKIYKYFSLLVICLLPFTEVFLYVTDSISGVFIDQATGYLSYNYNTSAYPIILIYPLSALFGSLIMLKIASRTYEEKVDTSIIGKTAIYALLIVFTTYFMPVYIIENLVIEFALFNAITIWYLYFLAKQVFSRGLIDIRRNSSRYMLRILIRALVVVVFTVPVFYIYEALPADVKVLEIVTLVIIAIIGWTVGERLSTIISGRSEVSLRELNESLQSLRSELDSDVLTTGFVDILLKHLQTERVLFAYKDTGAGIGKIKAFYKNEARIKSSMQREKDLSKDLLDGLEFLFKAGTKNKQNIIISRESLKKVGLKDYYYAIIYKESTGYFMVLAGEKNDGEEYQENDMAILNAAVNEFSLVSQNAQQYTRIKRFNEELENKIKSATLDLQITNQKLREHDEAKDEFISMASHQLRTPLTSVKGYVSMVLEGDAGELNEQQKKLLTQAFISSQRMVYLIADLLNVSRMRTGKFIIERTPTYLPEVVAGELEQLREAAEAKGLKLNYDKPEGFPRLELDETKTRQVIMNFIDNAVYYTPSGGKIRIELEAKPQSVEFRVVDTGLGVPKAEQPHLFSKFYRAENARALRPDGTGLGLFMAKKVVIAQGGAIIFRSVEGKGSTFGFTLPRNK